MLGTLLSVAFGGALGAAARYLTGIATLRVFGPAFPWGTFVVNIAGSFLMGLVVVVLAQKGGTRVAPFLLTGLLGGFTTFSAFSLDAVSLWERGATTLAAAYVGGSILMAIAALVFGLAAGRALVQ